MLKSCSLNSCKSIAICITLILFFGYSVCGQNKLDLKKYTVEDGLSQSNIKAIAQDSLGFIWIGTDNGLNRFDGYSFKVFRNDPTDSSSLCNNSILSLLVASNGEIWIGTINGLSVFNPWQNVFNSYFYDETDQETINAPSILSLHEARDGSIFIGTNRGLNKVIPNANGTYVFQRFESKQNPDNNSMLEGNLRDIDEDNNGNLWLASSRKAEGSSRDIGSLTFFDRASQSFTHYSDNSKLSLSSYAVQSVTVHEHELFVGTINVGVYRILFDQNGRILKGEKISSRKSDEVIPNNFIKKIIAQNNTVWLATYTGIASIDLSNDQVIQYRNEADKQAGVASLLVYDLLMDSAGNLWIASENGLFVKNNSHQNFEILINNEDNESASITGDIFAISEDYIGNIWLASYGSGLSSLNYQDASLPEIINYTTNKGLPTSQILGITKRKDKLWMASYAGIIELSNFENSDEVKFRQYLPSNSELTSKYYTEIFSDTLDNLWARTFQQGIDQLIFSNDSFQVVNHRNVLIGDREFKVVDSFVDSLNQIWFITDSTLVKVSKSTHGKISSLPVSFENTSWKNLNNLVIRYLYCNDYNNLWLGTEQGLVQIYFVDGMQASSLICEAKLYTEADGLINNTIYAIAEDSEKNLWLSTNKGISKLTPDKNEFTNYIIEGGESINEFNEASVFKDSKGKIYFGGIGGLVGFYPDSIKQNSFLPPVALTSLKVLNKEVLNFSADAVINQSIVYADEIRLSYTDYFFSLGFSALNFIKSAKNNYKYKLEGFHDDWVNAGSERQATFTNLDDGTYTFRVTASNNDGVWSDKEATIKIIVDPPPWQTWWAYTIYAGLFICGILALFKIRERELKREIEIAKKIESAKTEERIKVRTKTSQDFHDEAGNKITKINLFASLAKREAGNKDGIVEHIDKIQENTKELSNGMRDFLWVLDAGKDSLFDMIERMEQFGNSMFELTEISFSVNGNLSEYKKIILPMEVRRTLVLIFKEAANNSLKYSNADSILLNVSCDNDNLKISFSDDGCGFSLENKSKGYGLNNMKARAEKLNGKLEIISSNENGTKIIFEGNITHMSN